MMKKTMLTCVALTMLSFNVATMHADDPLNNSLLFQVSRVCFQLGHMFCSGISDINISYAGLRTAIQEAKAEDCQRVALCTGVVASLLAYMNSDNNAFARNIAWSPEATALAMTTGSAMSLTLFGDLAWSNFFTKAGLSAIVLTVATAIKHAYAHEQDEAYYKRLAKTLVSLIGPSTLFAGLTLEPCDMRDTLTVLGAAGTLGSALACLR